MLTGGLGGNRKSGPVKLDNQEASVAFARLDAEREDKNLAKLVVELDCR